MIPVCQLEQPAWVPGLVAGREFSRIRVWEGTIGLETTLPGVVLPFPILRARVKTGPNVRVRVRARVTLGLGEHTPEIWAYTPGVKVGNRNEGSCGYIKRLKAFLLELIDPTAGARSEL